MARRLVGRAAVAAAASVLLVSACGSSNSKSSTPTSSGGTPQSGNASTPTSSGGAQQPPGAPIKIMTIYTQHSASFSQPFIGESAQAAVNLVNAAGGVDGHPLKLVLCNEGADPNLATQCGVQASQQQVSALVGSQSVFSTNYYASLTQASIPNIGESPTTSADNTNPLSFPFGAAQPVHWASLGVMMADAGCKKTIPLAPDIAALKESIANFEAGVTVGGGGAAVLPTISFPLGNPDDSPQAAKVASSGADCAIAVTDSPDMEALLPKLHQLAPNVKVGWTEAVLSSNAIAGAGPGADGQIISTQAQALGTSTPDTVKYLDAMKQYYPDEKVLNDLGENAFAAVLTFDEVAKGLKSYDSASVVAALNKQCNLTVPLFATVDFCKPGPVTKAPRLFNTKAYQLTIKNGQYVSGKPGLTDSAAALSRSAGV